VQAVCSGLVAGQMGEGTIKAGAKHATVMLLIAYGTFLFLG
jgi:flagellar protein FlaJ